MSLVQVIEWLNQKYIVSLYRENNNIFFFQKYIKKECESIENNEEKIIILKNEWTNLMNEGEWDWYILNENCILLETGCCSIDELKNKIQCAKKQYYTIE